MGISEWAAVVLAGCAVVSAAGGLVWWMMLVYGRLSSMAATLAALKAQMLLDAGEHSEEHRRLWHALEDHEDRIRTVERRE